MLQVYVILYDMDTHWILDGVGDQLTAWRLRRPGDHRAIAVSPVLTARDVCRRLGKSRRQVYRYVRTGRLQPCGRVLGQWLFAATEVERCGRRSLPVMLRPFFWDVRLSSLSLDRHGAFIMGRLLEFGDRPAIRWLLRSYPRKALAAFLNGRGREVLPKRTWRFWALQLGIDARRRRRAGWRFQGRAWGGVS